MKKVIFLFLLAFSFLLTACGTTDPVVIRDTKLVAPEDAMLVNCPIEVPPTRDEYLRAAPSVNAEPDYCAAPDTQVCKDMTLLRQTVANLSRREKLLMDYLKKQMLTGVTCNVRMEALRNWKIEQKKIYEAEKAEKAAGKTDKPK